MGRSALLCTSSELDSVAKPPGIEDTQGNPLCVSFYYRSSTHKLTGRIANELFNLPYDVGRFEAVAKSTRGDK